MTWKITDDVVLERYHFPSVKSQMSSSRTVCLCTQILQKCENSFQVVLVPFAQLSALTTSSS